MFPFLNTTRAPSFRSRTSSSAWRICLCWVLCLSVWRGPVPIVHQHALDVQTLGNNVELAEHAIEFHASGLGGQSTGLHLHLVMLDGCSASLLAHSCSSDLDLTGSDLADSASADGRSNFEESLAMLVSSGNCEGCGCQAFGADNELRFEQLMLAALDARCTKSRLNCGDVPNVATRPRFSTTADMNFLQTQLSGATACALLCVVLC